MGNSSVHPYKLTVRYLETIPPVISETGVKGRTVSFKVSEDARVFVKVLTSREDFVVMIADGIPVKKGKVSLTWDGKDAHGRDVLRGTYKLKIVAIDGSGNKSRPVYTSITI